MRIEKWSSDSDKEDNIMVVMDIKEAIHTIKSLSTQLLEDNANTGRVEMRYGKDRSAEFSIAVIPEDDQQYGS